MLRNGIISNKNSNATCCTHQIRICLNEQINLKGAAGLVATGRYVILPCAAAAIAC